ncbi:hypothetical protein [Zhongshania aliphaticivorans]|jgi:hypothetical protein|uniref:hypothetical protein n=1 Tax=Zhongshania aliphaticivorans TaxID=1470434 RepID=UPI0039C92ABF
MDAQEAHKILTSYKAGGWGYFLTPHTDQPLGVGMLYSNVRHPLFNPEDDLFDTVASAVLVLSHECDIDPDNDRPFNNMALVCPILPFENVINDFITAEGMSSERITSFLSDIAKGNISRVEYIPQFTPNFLPYGGIIYLNQICHTHVKCFELDGATPQATLTQQGLQVIDMKMTNHLLRPKSISLPSLY